MGQYTPRYELTEIKEAGVDGEQVGQYSKRISIVDVIDQDGNPWVPVPGPDPWDDLVVAQKATWSDGNVYAVGEDIAGVSATYTGGTDQVVYRSRTQHRPAGSSSWINSPWNNHTNTPQVIHFVIPAGEENGEVRFQTQARDNGVDPVDQVNSFASVKQIAPLEWGEISQTVSDNPYDPNIEGAVSVPVNTPIICSVSVANAPSDLAYEWSRRGTDDVLIGTPTAQQTVITFPEQGVFTVTVNLKSNKTAAWESAIFNFIAS